jgi:hypothetical protein
MIVWVCSTRKSIIPPKLNGQSADAVTAGTEIASVYCSSLLSAKTGSHDQLLIR